MAMTTEKSEQVHNTILKVTQSLKKSVPLWENFLKASQKYHASMVAASVAAQQFLSEFSSLAKAACRAEGSTADIGLGLGEVVEAHEFVEIRRGQVIDSLYTDVIAPLADSIGTYKDRAVELEKNYKAANKAEEANVKAAEKASAKISKKTMKKNATMTTDHLMTALQNVTDAVTHRDDVRASNLRAALVEERRRFCFLLMHYCTVTKNEIDAHQASAAKLEENLGSWLNLSLSPDELPERAAEMVDKVERTFVAIQDDGGYGGGGYGGYDDAGFTAPSAGYASAPVPPSRGAPPAPGGGSSGAPSLLVLYDFDDGDPESLPLREGDVITSLEEEDDGWMKGRDSSGREGWFPATYVEVQQARTAAPPPRRAAPPPARAPAPAPSRGPPPLLSNSRGPPPPPSGGGGPPAPPPPPSGGGPPPPPPPPSGGGRSASGGGRGGGGGGGGGRGALLSSIQSGTRLKKTVTNDRSAPKV